MNDKIALLTPGRLTIEERTLLSQLDCENEKEALAQLQELLVYSDSTSSELICSLHDKIKAGGIDLSEEKTHAVITVTDDEQEE